MLVSIQQNCIWCCLWLQAIFLSLCSQMGTVNASASTCHPANNLFVFFCFCFLLTDYWKRLWFQGKTTPARPAPGHLQHRRQSSWQRWWHHSWAGWAQKTCRPRRNGKTARAICTWHNSPHLLSPVQSKARVYIFNAYKWNHRQQTHKKQRHKGWDFHMIKI